jgi:serine/threonine protein phosphatase PrpC
MVFDGDRRPPLSFLSCGPLDADGRPDWDRCEDAEPGSAMSQSGEHAFFVADGVGGYSGGLGGYSGGYWASLLVRYETLQFLEELQSGFAESEASFAQRLTVANKLALNRLLANSKASGTGKLRGELVQYRFASTLAGCVIGSGRSLRVRSFWIGDSRLYWLSSHSLHQLSDDDVKHRSDAFQSLRDDSPMSQFLAANMPESWGVHVRDFSFPRDGLLLACTDGCFGYWSSPWEFELAMIRAFRVAADWDTWLSALRSEIDIVKQDDASLSCYPLVADYTACQESMLVDSRPCHLAASAGDSAAERQAAWHNVYRVPYEGGVAQALAMAGNEASGLGSSMVASRPIPKTWNENGS